MDDEIIKTESEPTQSSQEGGSSSSISHSLAISSIDIQTPKTATLRRKYPMGSKPWKGSDNRDVRFYKYLLFHLFIIFQLIFV